MKRIMIIEDEYFLLDSMVKYLSQLENVRVTGCISMREARDYLERHQPDLIFSDINLPDGSGLELINALANGARCIPLVFVSAYISDYRAHIPPNSNIMVLEKPISLKRLREIAKAKLLGPSEEYHFKLSDYLQIAAMGGHTVRLDVADRGEITMVGGKLWSARDKQGEGPGAFSRLVKESEFMETIQNISCRRIREEDIDDRNLEGDAEGMLLQAVWEEEEAVRRRGPAQVVDEAQAASCESFSDLLERGVEQLLIKDYPAALATFMAAHRLDPKHKTVNANLERLGALGFAPSAG